MTTRKDKILSQLLLLGKKNKEFSEEDGGTKKQEHETARKQYQVDRHHENQDAILQINTKHEVYQKRGHEASNKEVVEDSPFDVSDADPDFDPCNPDACKKRKLLPQYFKNSDLLYCNAKEKRREDHKNRKIIDYKDDTQVFPNIETWEIITLISPEKHQNRNIEACNKFISILQTKANKQDPSGMLQQNENRNSLNSEVMIHENDVSEKHELSLEETSNKSKSKTARSADTKKKEISILPPCITSCRKKCFEKLSSAQRLQTFQFFKSLNFREKQLFFDKYLIKNDIKYRKVNAVNNKKHTVSYCLPAALSNLSGEVVLENAQQSDVNQYASSSRNMLPVCKTMFLHTLGFKTDGSITAYLRRTSNDIPCLKDNRGIKRGTQMKEISQSNYDAVKKHIDTFHPQVSHYNLAHAPNRRYLPPDLTVQQMHRDYISKNNLLSYECYRKVFEKENIGFASPSQDDCGICSIYKQHVHEENKDENENSASGSENPFVLKNTDLCTVCENYKIHKKRYTTARQEYSLDSTKQWDSDYELYAVDMQKVLILPKMPIKNSFFISRLVVFHETFANLKSSGKNKCLLWHEAIKGRNGPDVVSAYYKAITTLDASTKYVIFWADNCVAQNKNWALYTACITFVNEAWGPESITFKYFEPGHSFMKADAIHGQIGKKWNKTSEILDLDDLESLIALSNKKNKTVRLSAEDFRPFENGCMGRKKGTALSKLNEIKSAQFRKGSKKLFYKRELDEKEFSEVSVLNPKFKLEVPHGSSVPRGLNSSKKETILKELGPHMPPRKLLFWSNLQSNAELEDLGKITGHV